MTSAGAPGPLHIWGQIAAVVALAILGSLLGVATPWLAMGPILAMVLPLTAATWFLRREGLRWRDLGFLRSMPWRRLVLLALGAAAAIVLLTSFVVTPLMRLFGAPPPDPSLLVEAVQGDFTSYLLFLIPVSWGSAAFGEELLTRGFLLNRFTVLFGRTAGVLLQALVFALGHVYQGFTGVVNLFVVGLVFGWFYLRAGCNLWPVIVAHGIIDSVSITLVYLGYAQPEQ